MQTFRSEIFEKSYQLQTGPRAAGHYGPDLEVMKRAGIYEIFAEAAHFQDGLVFRAPPVDDGKGGKTFGRDIATIREPQLTFPQSTIVPLLVMEIAKTGLAKIHFGKEVVGIKQDENLVILSTKGCKTGEVEQVKGEYLAGTDGGRSVVRSLLGIGFPGHTWKERVIATNVTLTNEALAPTGSHLVFTLSSGVWSYPWRRPGWVKSLCHCCRQQRHPSRRGAHDRREYHRII